MLEVWIAKLHGDIHFKGLGDIYTQVYWTRSGFVTLGAGVLLYSLITYKYVNTFPTVSIDLINGYILPLCVCDV